MDKPAVAGVGARRTSQLSGDSPAAGESCLPHLHSQCEIMHTCNFIHLPSPSYSAGFRTWSHPLGLSKQARLPVLMLSLTAIEELQPDHWGQMGRLKHASQSSEKTGRHPVPVTPIRLTGQL